MATFGSAANAAENSLPPPFLSLELIKTTPRSRCKSAIVGLPHLSLPHFFSASCSFFFAFLKSSERKSTSIASVSAFFAASSVLGSNACARGAATSADARIAASAPPRTSARASRTPLRSLGFGPTRGPSYHADRAHKEPKQRRPPRSGPVFDRQ